MDTSQRKNEFVSQSQTIAPKYKDLKDRKGSTTDFNAKRSGSIISQSEQTESGINHRQTVLPDDENFSNNHTFNGDPESDDDDDDFMK